MAAKYPYVLLSDADLSTPIEELEILATEANLDTIVIASRGMQESRLEIRQAWYREQMGKIFNGIVQLFCCLEFMIPSVVSSFWAQCC